VFGTRVQSPTWHGTVGGLGAVVVGAAVGARVVVGAAVGALVVGKPVMGAVGTVLGATVGDDVGTLSVKQIVQPDRVTEWSERHASVELAVTSTLRGPTVPMNWVPSMVTRSQHDSVSNSVELSRPVWRTSTVHVSSLPYPKPPPKPSVTH
jgi:hypothetical protein